PNCTTAGSSTWRKRERTPAGRPRGDARGGRPGPLPALPRRPHPDQAGHHQQRTGQARLPHPSSRRLAVRHRRHRAHTTTLHRLRAEGDHPLTDRPYTDDDLRTEAARQHALSVEDPDFMSVAERMEYTFIDSTIVD